MYTYFVKKVIRIVDGDTIDIEIDLGFDLTKKERVRLGGIDTPEKRTKNLEEKAMGLEATEYLTALLDGAPQLTVTTEKDGKFGRMIGTLYLSPDMLPNSINPNNGLLGTGTSINQAMIDDGYAWEYDGGTKHKDLDDLKAKRASNIKFRKDLDDFRAKRGVN